MLVARERFDYQELPLDGDKGRKIKRVRRIKPRTGFAYCSLAMILLCLAFLVTSRYAQITSLGYDIVSVKKQVQELDTENQLLQNKISQLNSLQHIEYVATSKLGMRKPEQAEGVQFVPVEYSKAGSKTANVEIASDSQSNPTQTAKKVAKRSFLVQTLVNLING